jgi:hypothetical protein
MSSRPSCTGRLCSVSTSSSAAHPEGARLRERTGMTPDRFRAATKVRCMRRALVGSILIPGALVVAPMGASMRHPALAAALAFVNSRCPALEREINTDLWDAGVKFNALYGNCQW